MSMQRFTSGLIPLIVDTTLADSEELPMGSYAGGAFVPHARLSPSARLSRGIVAPILSVTRGLA